VSAREWNPRYWLFARSQGHTPEEQMAADDRSWPGGLMTGFICWVGARWREFCRAHQVPNADQAYLKFGEQTDAMFDQWLGEQVVGAAETFSEKTAPQDQQ